MTPMFSRAIRPAAAARAASAIGASTIALLASPALAQCVPDASGLVVTCSGTSPAYSNTASGVTLTAQGGGTVSGPLVLGNNAAVSNAGTITGAAGSPALTVGTASSISNSGTISQANSGSTGVLLGDNSSLTNTGTLTAPAGSAVASFGRGGSFTNTASAPAAVTGNVVFDNDVGFVSPVGTAVSTFVNQNTSFGFAGNVSSVGSLSVDNAGLFNGSIAQSQSNNAVTILNEAAGTFTGAITTADPTTLTNNGTMTLNGISSLQSATAGGPASLVVNNATLNVGAAGSPGILNINGNFVQAGSGTLGVTLKAPNGVTPVPGTHFSQVFATGTASLGGTLALNVNPGYYPSGSTYNVVLASGGISGGFATVTGNALTFISFVPQGVVALGGGAQAYQLMAVRTTTYAAAIAATATPNELAIANAYQGVVTAADAAPGSTAATVVGQTDVLTAAQAQTFFDGVSPSGYIGYANALRDQANVFQRQVALRMTDQNSDHAEDGFWAQAGGAIFGKAARGTPNSRETGYNLALGYDFSGPKYVIGGAFSYSQDHLTYGLGNQVGHNNAYIFDGYGAYHLGPIVASGQVSYQLGNFASRKVIAIGASTATATASAKDHLLTATGTLGGDLRVGGLSFAPFAGMETQIGAISGFTESGAGAIDLTVARIRANRTDFLAGASLARASGELRPYLRATYRSQLGSGPDGVVTAYMNGDATTTFTVTGQPAARHQGDVDAGLNYVVNDEGGLYIGYQGTFRNDLTSHGFMAGLRFEF